MIPWKKKIKNLKTSTVHQISNSIYETMLPCSLKYRKIQKIKPKCCKDKKGKVMLSSCAVCNSKKVRFIKEQEASGLLGSLGLKTHLTKIHLLGDILFKDINWMK